MSYKKSISVFKPGRVIITPDRDGRSYYIIAGSSNEVCIDKEGLEYLRDGINYLLSNQEEEEEEK